MARTRRLSKSTYEIMAFMNLNPTVKQVEIAKRFKLSVSRIYQINERRKRIMRAEAEAQMKLNARTQAPNTEDRTAPTTDMQLPIVMLDPSSDAVHNPAHYKVGGIETIDFIEAKGLNYNLGNVVKYITRADHKGDRRQDLQKAMWYLKRELSAV